METKVCSCCGLDQLINNYHNKKDSKTGKYSFCKKCAYQRQIVWKNKNLDKYKISRKISNAKYKTNNFEKVKALKIKNDKIYFAKHKEKIMYKQKIYTASNKENVKMWARKYANKISKNLDEKYIVNQLCQKGFTKDQITPQLIEVHTLIIKTKRLCKTSQN